jgi:hypothetical protein
MVHIIRRIVRGHLTLAGATPILVALGVGACGGSSGEQAPAGTYAAMVTWTPPSLNTDGSALADATGYRVDYGDSPTNLTLSLSVAGASSTSATLTGLSAGTYYFAVTTLNTAGLASSRSQVVSRALP